MYKHFYLIVEIVIAALAMMLALSTSRLGRAERNNRKAVSNSSITPEESTILFQKAIQIDKANPIYNFNLGLHYVARRESLSACELFWNNSVSFPDSALVLLANAVTLSSKEPVFLLNQALIDDLSGNRNVAIALLEPMTRHNHCWTPIRLVFGLLQEKEGNKEQARQAYTQAIIQSPIVLESPFYKELIKRNQSLANMARIAALEETRALLIQKPSPLCRASLGEQEYYAGNWEEAVSILAEALAEQPSMNRPWMFLGRIAEEYGNLKKATDCYEKAVLLDKEDALAAYFMARIKGGASVRVEQMQDMISNSQRIGLLSRYKSRVLTPYLIVPDLEMYCTYDYVGEIQANQYRVNLRVQENLRAKMAGKEAIPLSGLTAEVAAFFVGTPCEAGLLDIWPERLRIRLDKTDPLHFVEMCIVLAETLKANVDASPESFYESYCERIQQLRYRKGIVEKFSDRIYYFSEWAAQAQGLNLLEENTRQYGHAYVQRFSYLSDHLMFLPLIGKEPHAKEEVLDIEKKLNASGPFFLISPDEITNELQAEFQNGDLIAFVSDRKGEDVSRLAFVQREGEKIWFVQASLRDKKITKVECPLQEEVGKGVRLFRIHQ